MLNKQVLMETSIVVDNSVIKTIKQMTLETFTENCETLLMNIKHLAIKKCSAKFLIYCQKTFFHHYYIL